MLPSIKRTLARLPDRWQAELKRIMFRRQIQTGRFVTTEKEYELLPSFLSKGDWALDIGANVGHYSVRMSDLVGETGRVIAFEPTPQTSALLAANVSCLANGNVTLMNVAVSDGTRTVAMAVPEFATGATNYYRARIGAGDPQTFAAVAIAIDSLQLHKRVRLIKIDVEGHEQAAIGGMLQLLKQDMPVLILETESDALIEQLEGFGYNSYRLPGSPNVVLEPKTDC